MEVVWQKCNAKISTGVCLKENGAPFGNPMVTARGCDTRESLTPLVSLVLGCRNWPWCPASLENQEQLSPPSLWLSEKNEEADQGKGQRE